MSAYEEGEEAYRSGDSSFMTPYDDSDMQFDEWEDGWADACFADTSGDWQYL